VNGLTTRQDSRHDVAVEAGVAGGVVTYMRGPEADHDLRLTSAIEVYN
jgi:hypothetical protein